MAQRGLEMYARRRARALDRCSIARCQLDTLLSLVQRARDTRFGREHGFAEISSLADYQRRVPLRDYEAFWKEYWQPAFPQLQGVTWPEQVPFFALSSGTTTGATKHVPVTARMVASNSRGAFTSMALFLNAHPRTPILTGRMFFLGGSTDLRSVGSGPNAPILAGDLSGISARQMGSAWRPYTFPPMELGLLTDWEEKLQRLAESSAMLPITVLSGIPSWMLALFERLKRVTGRATIAEIWPTLRLIVHGGTKFDPYRALFRSEIGSDRVRFLEIYACSEGSIATEDPRYQLLRLIPDNDIFFEFVPVEELGTDRPTRHGAANLETGIQYAVVLTTCAGLWSYILGDTVCFEKRDPPLLRFTGRTRYFLSAFGEHLISEEVERAVASAAEVTSATVREFHVGPVFPETPGAAGRHRYLVEFVHEPQDLAQFAVELDSILCRLNEDYQAHRSGDLTLAPPDVRRVPPGGFTDWMRRRGKLGGQHKVPRMDNSGAITNELSREFV
jgi:hypothetical protein